MLKSIYMKNYRINRDLLDEKKDCGPKKQRPVASNSALVFTKWFTWSWCTWWLPWYPQRRHVWPIHREGGACNINSFFLNFHELIFWIEIFTFLEKFTYAKKWQKTRHIYAFFRRNYIPKDVQDTRHFRFSKKAENFESSFDVYLKSNYFRKQLFS